jgi:hypothetical protein
MKTMIAVRLAASAILVLGGANCEWRRAPPSRAGLALAEPKSSDNLSGAVDWGQFNPAEVPDAVKNLVTKKMVMAIRPATMQCPSTTDTTPTMTLVAEKPVPDWPNFNETGFVCQMSGFRCGFGDMDDEPITTTSSHVTVEDGILTLRCSADVTNLQ